MIAKKMTKATSGKAVRSPQRSISGSAAGTPPQSCCSRASEPHRTSLGSKWRGTRKEQSICKKQLAAASSSRKENSLQAPGTPKLCHLPRQSRRNVLGRGVSERGGHDWTRIRGGWQIKEGRAALWLVFLTTGPSGID
jgi:hypothetical protein